MLIVTAVEEYNDSKLDVRVFPNPTNELINVKYVNNLKKIKVSLFDLAGKLLETRLISEPEGSVQFKMREYAMADYLLRIYTIDGSINITYKIVKTNTN